MDNYFSNKFGRYNGSAYPGSTVESTSGTYAGKVLGTMLNNGVQQTPANGGTMPNQTLFNNPRLNANLFSLDEVISLPSSSNGINYFINRNNNSAKFGANAGNRTNGYTFLGGREW